MYDMRNEASRTLQGDMDSGRVKPLKGTLRQAMGNTIKPAPPPGSLAGSTDFPSVLHGGIKAPPKAPVYKHDPFGWNNQSRVMPNDTPMPRVKPAVMPMPTVQPHPKPKLPSSILEKFRTTGNTMEYK